MHHQGVGTGDQTAIQPAPRQPPSRPPIEQPDALCEDLRTADAGTAPKQEQCRQILELGTGPDYVGDADRMTISPGVNQVEAQYQPQTGAQVFHQPVFRLIFRVLDRPTTSSRMEEAIGEPFVEAGDLSACPSLCPITGAKSV